MFRSSSVSASTQNPPRIIQKQASDKRGLTENLNAGIRGEHSSTAALSHACFYSLLSSCKVTRMAHCSSVTPFFLMGEFSGPLRLFSYCHVNGNRCGSLTCLCSTITCIWDSFIWSYVHKWVKWIETVYKISVCSINTRVLLPDLSRQRSWCVSVLKCEVFDLKFCWHPRFGREEKPWWRHQSSWRKFQQHWSLFCLLINNQTVLELEMHSCTRLLMSQIKWTPTLG